MIRQLTTLVLALCLGAATTATAGVKVTSDPPDDGPVAAGKRVVWGFAARTAGGNRTTERCGSSPPSRAAGRG